MRKERPSGLLARLSIWFGCARDELPLDLRDLVDRHYPPLTEDGRRQSVASADISDLASGQAAVLLEQIEKMRAIVPAPKVMEIPTDATQRVPAMISANDILAGQPYTPMELPEYFAARVTTTLDGCTNPETVAAVKESSLSKLRVSARLRLGDRDD